VLVAARTVHDVASAVTNGGQWELYSEARTAGPDSASLALSTVGGSASQGTRPYPNGRGNIIDVRATPSGKWIYGVEDATGEVSYYTSRALGRTQG
jgi:hypothetical protein